MFVDPAEGRGLRPQRHNLSPPLFTASIKPKSSDLITGARRAEGLGLLLPFNHILFLPPLPLQFNLFYQLTASFSVLAASAQQMQRTYPPVSLRK